jgi:hypothetical protein
LNIDKFFGWRATYHDLPSYQVLVDCQHEHGGTYSRSISQILGRARRWSWCKAKQFLQDGNCIVVMTQKGWGHYYLITTDQYGAIITVNQYRGGKSTYQIGPQAAANLLRHAQRTWYVEKGPKLL